MARTQTHQIGRAGGLRGFTIPEILVSLFILTFGIIAATSLVSYLLRTTRITREELVATNLARESLEAVRNVRDTNWQANSGSQRDADDDTREHWKDELEDAIDYTAVPAPFLVPVLEVADDAAEIPQPVWHLYSPGSDRYALNCSPDVAALTPEEQTQVFRDEATGRAKQLCADAASGDEPTIFRRELEVRFLDATSPSATPTTDPAVAKMVWVRTRVRWYGTLDATAWDTATPLGEVSLETVFTDWFGRKEKATTP